MTRDGHSAGASEAAGAKMTPPSTNQFKFITNVTVRFRDLDAMGHVNNAVYFTYFEIARAAYFRAFRTFCASNASQTAEQVRAEDDSMEELFPFILAEASCRYLAPVQLGEDLVVALRTSSVGRKSFDFEYLVTRQSDDVPVASGKSTQVYFDYGARRTIEVPERFREFLEELEDRPFSSPHG